MTRRVTDAELDAEMAKRGLYRPTGGAFVGEPAQWRLTPVETHPANHHAVRNQIRAEMEAAADSEQAHVMTTARHIETGTAADVVDAILQAQAETGRLFTSKAQAASQLSDRVNELLIKRGFDPRTERSLRRNVPNSILR